MRITYRPEIDGLRAVAIVAVILYHAELTLFGREWLSGGYIGVDVFFVISGYLISKLILHELRETHRFDFMHFYERRARRILPALLIVMLASFPLAWHFLLPLDYVTFSESILASLLFVSNLYFYQARTEYGADSALLEPFLHTWSLSVEEQFYILFPAVLLYLYRRLNRYLVPITLAVMFVSLQFSEIMASRDSSLNFYLLPSRAWELVTGTLLAVIEARAGRRFHPWLHFTLPILGACMLSYALLRFDATIRHPGYITILPVAGTALLILFSNGKDAIGRLLSSRLCVSIGLISYSLYLWHFPVFAFARIANSSPTIYDKAGWIAASVALAVLSFLIIERPFRSSARVSTRSAFACLTVGCCAIAVSNGATVYHAGFPERLPPIFVSEDFAQQPWDEVADKQGVPCHNRDQAFCQFGDVKPNAHIVLMGDSQMSTLQGDLMRRLTKYSITSLTYGGCWPVRGFDKYESDGRRSQSCGAEYHARWLSAATKVPGSIIVLSGRLPLYLSGTHFDNGEGGVDGGAASVYKHREGSLSFEEGIRATIYELLEAGHAIVVVYPIPEVGWNVAQMLLAKLRTSRGVSIPEDFAITTSYEAYRARVQHATEVLDGIVHGNLHRVYPHKLFCNTRIKGRCVTHDAEHLYYVDSGHPSRKGAKMINDLIMEKIAFIEWMRRQ